MNILLTSAGRRGYLVEYFKDALQGKGKVYASNSEYTIALQKADGYFLSPLIYQDTYIDALIGFCKQNDITALLSVFDIDLLVLAKNREKFEVAGIKLLLASPEAVEICNDKWKTAQMLQESGIATPKTYKSIESVKEALASGEMSYPVVIKPRWGMASMGIYFADNELELDVFYEKSQKQVQNSYLKYESGLTPGEDILFQEKLDGQEYGVDVINDLSSRFVCALPKSKLLMRAGETDLGQSVSPVPFEKIAKILSEKIGHQVILSVDCFEVNGEMYVTELNCRISGHYPLSHVAGVNLPKQIVEWLDGKETNMENFAFREGVYVTKDLIPVEVRIP